MARNLVNHFIIVFSILSSTLQLMTFTGLRPSRSNIFSSLIIMNIVAIGVMARSITQEAIKKALGFCLGRFSYRLKKKKVF